MHNLTIHQQEQIKVIDKLEQQVKNNQANFSTVDPVSDYTNDKRITLTGVHFPNMDLIQMIQNEIINPLKKIDLNHFYYPLSSFHMSIKNIRVVANPPNFTGSTIEKAKRVFQEVIPNHKSFKVYFYRLLFFQNNLAIVGTTDPELDEIIFDLDESLKKTNTPDDKRYINSKYFFSNMTLIRFSHPPSKSFVGKAKEISEKMRLPSYSVDSVSLISTNVVLSNKKIYQQWHLKPSF